MAHDSIKQFVKELLTTSGLVAEGESFDDIYVDKMAAEVEKYLGLELTKRLSEDALIEYSQLLEKGTVDPEKAKVFFEKHIQDFPAVQKELFETYAKRFFTRTEAMRKSL